MRPLGHTSAPLILKNQQQFIQSFCYFKNDFSKHSLQQMLQSLRLILMIFLVGISRQISENETKTYGYLENILEFLRK